MTQVMEALKIGDAMEVKGPLGHFVYQGRGSFKHSGKAGTCRNLSMIAGGTGITPMWQVIQVRVICLFLFVASACLHLPPAVGAPIGKAPQQDTVASAPAVVTAVRQQCFGLHGNALLGLWIGRPKRLQRMRPAVPHPLHVPLAPPPVPWRVSAVHLSTC